MEVRRINPEGGVIREIVDLRKRVKSQETRASGNIVIRETLVTTDPESGVSTIVGQLPDGTYGIQPFVYDITPPPVATTPIVSAEPGMFTVSWDGKFVDDADQPKDFIGLNVIGHKIVGGATVQSNPIGQITSALNRSFISTDIVAVGETWQFSFESEDYNGNLSARSTRSAIFEMKSLATDAAVGTALNNLAEANAAADKAARDAQKAAQDAQDAADLVASDLTATDAAVAAAQLKANQAFDNAKTAADAAGLAAQSANAKGTNWYIDTAPAGTGHKVGDIWFDKANNNRVMTWDGTKWLTAQDSFLAKQVADSKGITYTQNVVPPVSARLPQNLWIDTSLGANQAVTKYWEPTANGGAGAWTPVSDKGIKAAQDAADAKGETIYSSTEPAAAKRLPQNLWIDTNGGININKRWDGNAWVVVADTRIAETATAVTAVDSKAQTALDTATSKGVVYTQNVTPPVSARLPQNLWVDTSLGLNNTVTKYWDGNAWTAFADKTATDAANLAGTKSKVIYSNTAPTGADATALTLWIDTTNNANTPKKWVSGTTWTPITDKVATDAAALAATKGKVLIQSTTPIAADQLPQNLWIDTTNGVNTPKRWNSTGSTWDIVTDKVALDAAAAASAAQGTANTALANASTADGKAVTAQNAAATADGKAVTAKGIADTAVANAATADGKAAQALADALAANNLAASKGKVLYQSSAPTGVDANLQTLWIDTTSNLNTPKRWTSGTTWVAVTDKVATDAAALAATKGKILYQDSAPTGTDANLLTLWINTTGGANTPMKWVSGTTWTSLTDKVASDAAALAATKGKILFQTTAPTGADASALTLWIDTTGGANTPKKWVSGTTWAAITDKVALDAAQAAANAALAASNAQGTANTAVTNAATAQTLAQQAFDNAAAAATAAGNAQTSANGKNRTWFQTAAPAGTGHAAGDIWFDTDDGNKPYVWTTSGTPAWTSARDATIATAQSKADSAFTVANGKTTTYYQTTQPTGGTYVKGDMWFDTDDNYKLYTYPGTGTVWQLTQDAEGARTAAISAAASATDTKVSAALTTAASTAQTKADQAKADAITAAATAADSKVATAKADALATAAADAKSKADAAQAAAIAAAATTAQLKADGAQQAAIDAAATTAQAKADAAKQAAITAAAADADSKAAAAQAAAIAAAATDAKAKADAAQAAAIAAAATDAQARATQAKTDAITAAASDATTKSTNAQTAAISAAATAADSKVAAAKAAALTEAAADAKSKADAAQAAAIAAAANTAQLKADGAQQAAIDAAALDAKNKADAAQAAAVTAAATAADAKVAAAKATTLTEAAATAQTKADAAQDAALLAAAKMNAFSGNASFEEWTTSLPNGYTAFTQGPTKETTIIRSGKQSARFNVSAAATQAGLSFSGGTVAGHLPNLEYYTVEMEFYLESGTLAGAGMILDWSGMTNNRATINLATEVPAVNLGKWYSVTKVLRRPTNATGTWTGMSGFLMANWTTFGSATKNIIFDWFNIRPSTTEEITSYGQTAAISAAQTAAATTAQSKADAAQAAAIAAAATAAQAKADAAQAAAIAAAATDAGTKATNAQQAAITAAAADAKTKADAAQAAAIAAAATAAQAKADAAQAAAIAAAATDASNKVATKSASYYEPTKPTGGTYKKGDVWFDTANGNRPNVHNGTDFVNAQDQAIFAVQPNVTTAIATAANGKNKVVYSTSDATGTTGYIAGDTWFKRDGAGTIIAQWEFTTSWQSRTLNESVIAAISAGKITTGTLAAARIGAGTIDATKIFVGDMTNLAADGTFRDTTKANWGGSGTVVVTAGEPNKLRIVTAGAGNNDQPNNNLIQVTPGDQIYAEAYVYGEPTNVGGGGPNIHLTCTDNNGVTSWPSFQSLTRAAVSGSWAKISGKVTIPANIRTAKVELAVSFAADAVGNTYYFREVTVRRMATGNLIVDGAITANSAIIANGAIGNAQIADLNADKITAGTIAAARLDAESIKSKIIEASYLQATDIFAPNSITSASGIFGAMDASVITAGTIAAARLDAEIIKSKLIEADYLIATDIFAPNSITSASGIFGTMNASIINAGTIGVDRLDANSIRAKIIEAPLIDAVNVIAQGSITATNGIIGSIDAGKISVGTLDAARIGAKSIAADKLLISSTDNMINEADFKGNGASWELPTNFAINQTAGRASMPAMVITNTAALQTSYNAAGAPTKVAIEFPSDGGNSYRVSAWVKSTVAVPVSGAYVSARFTLSSGGPVTVSMPYTTPGTTTPATMPTAGTWYEITGIITAPVNAISVAFAINSAAALSTGTLTWDMVSVTRAANGELIVDGAIDGKVITAPTIQSETAANRGIKLTSTELAGYNASGVKNFSLTSAGALSLTGTIQSGSTITGATLVGAGIETSATALRGVKLASSGITSYDSAGNLTFKVDAATGLVEAPGLKANTIKGDMIESNTIGVRSLIVSDLTNFAPSLAESPKDWLLTGQMAIIPSGLDPSGYRFNVTDGTVSSRAYGPAMAVRPGETLWMGATLYRGSGTTPDVYLRYEFQDVNKIGLVGGSGVNYVGAPQAAASPSGTRFEGTAIVPAGAAYARWYIIIAIGTGTTGFHSISGRRMLGGELIVDGAIDGKVITGPTIQTDTGATTGIKLTPTELAGWGGGVKNFSLTSAGALTLKGAIQSGSTIEGATITGSSGIQTSTTALRGIKITNTGINAYDSSGNLTYKLDAATGYLEVPGLKANSISGDLVKAGTLTADKVLISASNLHPDPNFLDTASWGSLTSITMDPVGGRTGGGSMTIAAVTGQLGAYYGAALVDQAKRIPVKEGSSYKISVWVKGTAAIPVGMAAIYTRLYNPNTATVTWTNPSNVSNKDIIPANVWTELTSEVKIPAGFTQLVLGLFKQSTHTAGTVSFSDLMVQSMADGNLIVKGSITADSGIIGSLDAGVISTGYVGAARIAADSITTEKLLVTGENLIPDPKFINPTQNAYRVGSSGVGGWLVAPDDASTANKIKTDYVTAAGSYISLRLHSEDTMIPVTPGMAYKFTTEYRIRGNTVAGQKSYMRFAVYTHSPMGVYLAYVGVGSYVEMAGTGATWKTFESPEYVVPANTGFIRVVFQMGTGGHSGEFEIKNPLMRRMADSSLIVGGAVTADKLEASLVLASKIVAGDPTGTRAEMTPGGFKVYSGNSPTEVVRLGVAATDDYFAVTKANGTLAASISQDGVGSFSELNANDALYFKGESLSALLNKVPRGPLYKAELSSDIDGITTTYGLVTGEYIADGTDRQIELELGIKFFPSAVQSEAYVNVKYTINGSAPTINSPQVFEASLGMISATSFDYRSYKHTIRMATMNPAGNVAGTRVRFLMCVTRGGGDQLRVRAGLQTYMYINDIGPGIAHSPSFTPGGGTIAAPPAAVAAKQNYVKQYGCTNSMNYQGNNAQYNWDLGNMYQGLSPAGLGNLKSIGLFDRAAITADLSGADVQYVRVIFDFKHWYYNAGGTARIGVHGHTGIPGTFTGVITPIFASSGGWPKPGARWVDIPSNLWAGFKSGAHCGVYLEGDSTYGTYGYSVRPTLEIGYAK